MHDPIAANVLVGAAIFAFLLVAAFALIGFGWMTWRLIRDLAKAATSQKGKS